MSKKKIASPTPPADCDDTPKSRKSKRLRESTDVEGSSKRACKEKAEAAVSCTTEVEDVEGGKQSNGHSESSTVPSEGESRERPTLGAPEVADSSSNGFFSSSKFAELPISEPLKKALAEMSMERLTEIQAKSIPLLLQGRDVLGAAQTGSGKTLAFLIPAFDLLYKAKFAPRNGTGVIVISPTRELALQIYDVTTELGKYVSQTHGLIMGGVNRKQEADRLGRGVNILIATPGRLLDHLHGTRAFLYTHLAMLIIDEADRILEIGFEDDLTAILKLLPTERQTALFSATQTTKVADLARLSLRKPILVQTKKAASGSTISTVEGLEQGYVVCEAQDRFKLLFTFLKRNYKTKKLMVFFSSCLSVKFHYELLNYVDLPVSCIHGKKKQSARMATYYDFCKADNGVLLCTDVASRGLDFPKVDWIVQYDPPDDPREYIHRVGRTARGAGGTGQALLFVMPQELGFLHFLKEAKVPLTEYKFNVNKIANVQEQLEKLVEKNYHLHRSSRDAYRSYIHAYISHALKEIFDVHQLDLAQVARSFGFSHPPKVELNLKALSKQKMRGGMTKATLGGTRKKHHDFYRKSGAPFSAANPKGKRSLGDKRQFVRG